MQAARSGAVSSHVARGASMSPSVRLRHLLRARNFPKIADREALERAWTLARHVKRPMGRIVVVVNKSREVPTGGVRCKHL